MNGKKLYRSLKNRFLAGVCGGLGDFLNFDATIIRVIIILLTVFTGFVPMLIIYAACALIIPNEPVRPSEDEVNL